MSGGEQAASSVCRTLLLIRHARSELAGRFCGHADAALSDEGRRQLPGLLQKLSGYPVRRIFSSDLLRARQTASFLAAGLNLAVDFLPELREISFGEWEGLSWEEIAAKDPGTAARWVEQYPRLAAPGGEEFEHFRRRVREAFDRLCLQAESECAAVVTHAGVIRSLLLDRLGRDERELGSLPCDYACCIELRLRGGSWRMPEKQPSFPM